MVLLRTHFFVRSGWKPSERLTYLTMNPDEISHHVFLCIPRLVLNPSPVSLQILSNLTIELRDDIALISSLAFSS